MFVYVGTYTGAGKGEGIYVFQFDPESGTLTATETVIGAANPSFLAIDPTNRFVFSANESDPGIVSAFHRDLDSGGLHELNQESSHGSSPCYISIDLPGRYAMVANYGDGTLAVYPIGEDGHLQPSSDVITFTGTGHDPGRQDGPHGHMVAPAPDGHFVLATDLGLDTITVYELDTDTGRLNPGSAEGAVVHAEPGDGPRHFAYSPDGTAVYVINELSNTVTAYTFADGGLRAVQTITTLPDDFHGENTTAQIAVTPDGRHVYGSNRGHDSIAIFAVGDDGQLSALGHQPSGGQTPRNFALDPTGAWLLAANQTTGNIVVFRRDPETGLLSQTGDPVEIPSPVAILFAEV
jgi:6-phosphogluconolactonase